MYDSEHCSLGSEGSSSETASPPPIPSQSEVYAAVAQNLRVNSQLSDANGITNQQDCRSRRSLSEQNNNKNSSTSSQPPNIAPVSGVLNLSNKVSLVRPIAFRPTPVSENQTQQQQSSQNTPVFQTSQHNRNINHPKDSLTQDQRYPQQNKGFAPGHPLVKSTSRHYGSSQDLNRLGPSNSSKFSSLDRRTLTKRHTGQVNSSNPLKLSAYSPGQEMVKVYKGGKEPERRHSSYYPASSLTRTPSQNSEYKHRSRVSGPENIKQPDKGGDPVNPMNVIGLPDPFRNHSNHNRPQSVRSTEPRSRLSGVETPQSQNLKSTSRASQGSLTNLNNIRYISSLKRTDSARKCPADNETGYEGSDEDYQTPSPADSAVGDLGNILQEKDSEINYLRETLEQNEDVIFRVYQEKEKYWEREIRKMKALYETQLKNHQQKSSKMEAALINQTYQVKHEKNKLENEIKLLSEKTKNQEHENDQLQKEIGYLRDHLESSEFRTCMKSGELSELQQEAEDCKNEKEIKDLHFKLKEYQDELEQTKEVIEDLMQNRAVLSAEITSLKAIVDGTDEDFSLQEIKAQKQIIIERDKQIEELNKKMNNKREEYDILKSDCDNHRENFEVETANWLSEKEKVIRYQKQLQLNYVSMYKKNKSLESEIEQLKSSLHDSQKSSGHVSSAKAKLFSKFSSKFSD